MKLKLYKTKNPRIEMLPLIDVVFLLLVFFIYAMLSMAVHRGLPVVLPDSSTAKIDKKLVLSVSIKFDGTIYIDEHLVVLEDLAETLKDRAGHETNPGVLLFADRHISYQKLFKVLDQIQKAGIHRISLQADSEKTP
ncbi:MAG: biopolymer transporter ExbD [Deltaproteobacteria bacterium]|nr:biopolymer transporter ExbD [Deltaproteobacteria bacterium]MBW2564453.1 biopolymer transporter ExbD [Deltaproteobacteria bacterium]